MLRRWFGYFLQAGFKHQGEFPVFISDLSFDTAAECGIAFKKLKKRPYGYICGR